MFRNTATVNKVQSNG